MSIPVTLVPGTLPYSCWPDNPQTLNVDIVTRIVAVLSTTFAGIYISASAPPADQRDKIWFNSTNQRLYQWINGAWQRTYDIPASDPFYRMPFPGTTAQLTDYGLGAGMGSGGVGPSSGPLWEVDHDYDDRLLVGVGPTICATVNTTYGSKSHTLTEAEGATGNHTHAFGLSNQDITGKNDDAFFSKSTKRTVPSYTGFLVTGGGSSMEVPFTDADLFTLPCGNDAKGVTPTAFDIVPPVRSVYWIKRTSRVYVPAPY